MNQSRAALIVKLAKEQKTVCNEGQGLDMHLLVDGGDVLGACQALGVGDLELIDGDGPVGGERALHILVVGFPSRTLVHLPLLGFHSEGLRFRPPLSGSGCESSHPAPSSFSLNFTAELNLIVNGSCTLIHITRRLHSAVKTWSFVCGQWDTL